MTTPVVQVDLPAWAEAFEAVGRTFAGDSGRMQLAVDLARENVTRGTGGPFGAAIFEGDTGKLVAIGVNSVVRLNNCALHAEMVAFMRAQAAIRSYSLGLPGMPSHELFTSCEPCAMCLGAVLLFQDIGDPQQQLIGVVLGVVDQPDPQSGQRFRPGRIVDASIAHFGGGIQNLHCHSGSFLSAGLRRAGGFPCLRSANRSSRPSRG